MSEKKITIDVKPDGRIRKEAFMIPPMVCPYCGGKGWFIPVNENPKPSHARTVKGLAK